MYHFVLFLIYINVYWRLSVYDHDDEFFSLGHIISTVYYGIILKSCKNTIITMRCVIGERNQERVLSADVGPPETNIINRSKCIMSIYIIIGYYIIKIEILFT